MMNLVHLGLYRRIFPDAKVLMVTRDPRDIIAECYIEYHTPSQATASFGSIPGIAESVQAYDALWQFAKSTFGMASMEVRYEDVVNDPARSMRRIAEWLGLSWDDGATKPDRRVRGKARCVLMPTARSRAPFRIGTSASVLSSAAKSINR